ncbi:hypothetical protein K2173_004624 [Erythroxylum novogranatense]|uniref:Peptidase S26 domain-containing protein n=1 Tax=Erythroxylum novogranatense TaxID=1862640 RepID=A0AAV8U865_9ROSI|nr:hypothetical protein K2173_004624 [Erythroxylum novogranatense]
MCTVEVWVRIALRMVAGLMSKWRSAIPELLGRTALVARFLCLLHVTNTYLCSPTLAYGPSMFPTLNMTGDVLLVEHLSQRFGKVRPGDVVVVRSPLDPRKILTKRIVGMAGHSVTFMPDPVLGRRSRTVVQLYLIDRYPKGMFGFKEIIYMTQLIHDFLGLYLMPLLKAKCYSGYGPQMALDPWGNK